MKELAKRLGFRDESLLERALTHSSYAHEEGRARETTSASSLWATPWSSSR